MTLIKEAHKRGMKVIFDGVFNHIGYNSKPFQDVLKNRKNSRYADWFHIDWEKSTPRKLCYEKFWGFVKEMPKLNYGSQDVKRYVFATLKRWLRPIVDGTEYEGIDGWRIDHAIGVPMTFWQSAHEFTKKLNNNSLFLAELIEPDTIIKPYLDNGAFDCVMNYGFYFLACEFFTRDAHPMTAKDFDKQIWQQLKLYPLHANYLAMNLLGTHDTERIASLIVNRDLKNYDGFNPIAAFFTNTHTTDRGYTSIGDFVTFTKRFPYTMTGYKGECDINGRQISKIQVESPQKNTSVASSKSSSNSDKSSSDNSSGNKTTIVVVEHHRDPVPVQEGQACFACGGMGTMGCDLGYATAVCLRGT